MMLLLTGECVPLCDITKVCWLSAHLFWKEQNIAQLNPNGSPKTAKRSNVYRLKSQVHTGLKTLAGLHPHALTVPPVFLPGGSPE